MKNGIIAAFLVLTTLFVGCYFGFKIADHSYVEIDGQYFTRYEVQKLLDEMENEEINA